MRGSRVLVTGGTGFLGSHVVPLLVSEGYDVVGTARSASGASRLGEFGAHPVAADLDDWHSIDRAFATARADLFVNLVSLGFGHAAGVVAAAEEAGVRRAIFISTTAIFTSLPLASKRVRASAEQEIRASSTDWTILRPTMIYGMPGDRNMERLLRLLRREPVVPLPGGGTRLQQPVHVCDVAAAAVHALREAEAVGRAYELAGPDPLTLRDIVCQAAAAVGRRPWLVPIPLGAAIAVLELYGRATKNPRLRVEQLHRLAEDKTFSIDGARNELGFDPRPFSVGIAAEAAMLGAV